MSNMRVSRNKLVITYSSKYYNIIVFLELENQKVPCLLIKDCNCMQSLKKKITYYIVFHNSTR